jgi:hypothetical protein
LLADFTDFVDDCRASGFQPFVSAKLLPAPTIILYLKSKKADLQQVGFF